MLTCINPDITFLSPSSSEKVRGFAVSLKWLCGLVRNSGNIPPREEPIRREIEAFGVGAIGNKKQYFNKNADGQTICRGAEGVEVVSRKCIFVNHSAFRPDAWKIFSEGYFTDHAVIINYYSDTH